ncbi:hypothetical protein [Kitasatospora sp. NPDC058218]|uniref:hypothetical protein n=1 Tax=Kitasatospora sp. NPDC058218 TaxID=3346385 RepID=UPI0036DA5FDF
MLPRAAGVREADIASPGAAYAAAGPDLGLLLAVGFVRQTEAGARRVRGFLPQLDGLLTEGLALLDQVEVGVAYPGGY